MTQTQWGTDVKKADLGQAELLQELIKQMYKRMDEHFGNYEPASPYSTNIVDEVQQDFELVFRKLQRFDEACHALDSSPEAVKAVLNFDFIDRYQAKIKKEKESWK